MIIAVLGMFSIGLAMIRGSATAIAIGVLMTMPVSVTLLPAILGFVGTNVDRLGLPHRRRGDGAGEGAGAGRRSIGYRWSRVIQRRRGPRWPWPPWCWFCWRRRCSASGSSSATPGNRPTSDTTRQAYGLLSDGFGDGFNGPFLLGAETPSGPPTWRCWRTRRTR